MLSRFFIDRPIFAWVVSIVILLAGGVCAFTLPIAQYPDITPPTVQVTASYPGANAQVVADSVAAPIEQQVNGVEGMLYMSSQCTNDGAYNLTVTFDIGVDLDMAQVLVQNRVSLAMPQLPSQVQVQGVSTKKKSPSILLAVNLVSPDGSFDDIALSNFATIQIKDELLRIDGVGDITYLGERDYSMRIWLDPQKMASRSLTANDVINAVKSQNVQVAAGQIGQQPVPAGQQFQYTMSTLGRLQSEEEFRNIILKASQGDRSEGRPAAQVVRVRDVADVNLGAQQYDQICRLDGQPSVALAVFQLPGSNALDTADQIKKKMEELSKGFPRGVKYEIVYDTTPFIQQSVDEVFKTLRDAVILVAIVVLFFLQDWKAMILPMIDVPVSLVGTFAVMALLGFSLNNLTLFGLVLAIGIVVDDAIVVLENVERLIATGLDVRTATIKAMEEITGPIIAITLVLSSVFIPSVFFPGIPGLFFRQFALTITVAMIISAINAMTLTPSRAVAIFKTEEGGGHAQREAIPWWLLAILGAFGAVWAGETFLAGHLGIPTANAEGEGTTATRWFTTAEAVLFVLGAIAGGAVGWFTVHPINAALSVVFRGFNKLFDWLTAAYGRGVARLVRFSAMVLIIYVGLIGLTVRQMRHAPTSFLPIQDQGYLLVNVQLPDAASVQRTERVMDLINKIALGDPNDLERYPGIPGVDHTLSVAGQSILMNANGSNFGSCFVILEPFAERETHEKYDAVIAEKLRTLFAEHVEEAQCDVFRAPPIQGLGNSAGFKIEIEQRGRVDYQQLQAATDQYIRDGNKNPLLQGLFTMYRADAPQYYLDIDRTKCESLGVNVQDVFDALQVYMGGYFVNLFNEFGRTWQVNLLGQPQFRTQQSDLRLLYVRNKAGGMVPLATLLQVNNVGGPVMVTRYNMYNAAPVVGNGAAGVSSGEAVQAMSALAESADLPFEWTEIVFLQLQAGNTGIYVFALGGVLVFLVLAAKYESWKLPMAVILVVPMCILCSVTGMMIARLPVDLFVQIGFLVLVGLAAKNAVLIVEFANQMQMEGKPVREAIVDAARLRLRPIVMTSFAFILGVAPLVLAEGAGAEMRESLGTAVFSGMIGVTAFGIFLTPVFYFVIVSLRRKPKTAGDATPADHA